MTGHIELSELAVDVLKRFDEVSSLVLYGSVARGDYRQDSDIDIAFICDDSCREFPLDLEGIPDGLKEGIDAALKGLRELSGIIFHVPIYWQSEYDQGILLPARHNQPSNLLHQVGKKVYSSENDLVQA